MQQSESQIFHRAFQFQTRFLHDYPQKEQDEACSLEKLCLHYTINGFAGFKSEVPTQKVVL